MSPEEAVSILENKRQKVLKRIQKEEKDILKLHDDLTALNLQQHQVEQLLSNQTAAESSQDQEKSELSTPEEFPDSLEIVSGSALKQLPLETNYMISNLDKKEKALRTEIDSLLLKFMRVKGEEEELMAFFTLNLQHRYQLNEWMISVQSLLWPKSKEEEDAGRPLLNNLPSGVLACIDAVNKLGLDKIHDVRVIIDGFRWLTWCFQCLTVLRLPPTTKQLKKLYDNASTCKLADEKVVKAISGMSSRAT
jgi:hypothetical protein